MKKTMQCINNTDYSYCLTNGQKYEVELIGNGLCKILQTDKGYSLILSEYRFID